MAGRDAWFGTRLSVDGALATDIARAAADRAGELSEHEMRVMARAHSVAMVKVVDRYKGKLQADIAGSGIRNAARFSKTWRGRKLPAKDSMEPAGWFWNKAGIIINALTYGVEVTVRNRKYLAIPVGPAKVILERFLRQVARSARSSGLGRDAQGRYEALGGPVQIVCRALGVEKLEMRIDNGEGGQGYVLVAPGKTFSRTGRQSRRGGEGTVLFVLRRKARIRGGRMRGAQLFEEFRKRFEGDFIAELVSVLGPENKP
ncbi:hypothetical protein [Caulobacter sp. 1776]|uniref:hypothetical protein n=1 Tax=Caulobacter sp. 1776 TaxID=3156420 RepID=UPI003392BE4A